VPDEVGVARPNAELDVASWRREFQLADPTGHRQSRPSLSLGSLAVADLDWAKTEGLPMAALTDVQFCQSARLVAGRRAGGTGNQLIYT